jgi:phosphoglycerol transferase MdoB-like AlkP superfamily enzyme
MARLEHPVTTTNTCMNTIPRLTRFLAVTALIYIIAFSLMRLAFWGYFNNPSDPLTGSALLKALYIGFKFDVRLTLFLILPIFLLGWIRVISPLYSSFGKVFWSGYLILATIGVMLFYALDFGHYSYLNIRVDSTVLRFLENPLISGQMVWESYPVIWISLGLGVAVLLFAVILIKLMEAYSCIDYRPLSRWRSAAVVTVTVFALLFGIYGKISWYPLRWNDAFFGTNAFASAVALNPVLYFTDTYLNGGLPYDEAGTRKFYPLMADYLGASPKDSAQLNFSRPVEAATGVNNRPNVVIFLIESFASYKTSLSGNPLDPTPEFAKIAQEGVYFKNFFTPHTGTAHSVFALLTGSPDVQLGDTSSRNPTIISQHLLINSFTGYEKFYFLGGSASWRNIRALFTNNIPEVQIYEEGSYDAPRNDVWGISDLNLMKAANQVFAKQEKPFFAIVQTSGNHRPYTIPDDNDDFESITPQFDASRYGFDDAAEFNAYRLTDYDIGRFFELARNEPYFDNTVFLFLGDHGINGNAGEHSLKQETQLLLGSYRVPLVLYAPKLLKGGEVFDKVASEVDIMTTLASLTGHNHINTTFGRDLFEPAHDETRYAFTINHAGVPLIGLIGDNFYFRMRADGSDRNLFKLGTDAPRTNHAGDYPEIARQMAEMTLGYYETARYVINHNRPVKQQQASK